MEPVLRYDTPVGWMETNKDGDYVTFEDYMKLKSLVCRLQAELVMWKMGFRPLEEKKKL